MPRSSTQSVNRADSAVEVDSRPQPRPAVPLGGLLGPARPAGSALNGYHGDGFASSIELVVTPLLLVLAGVGVDRWLGTSPWFAVAFGLFGIAGVSAKQWFIYKARLSVHQDAMRSDRAMADQAAKVERAKADLALAAERTQVEQVLAEARPTDALPLDTLKATA